MTTHKPNTGIPQNEEIKTKESEGMFQEKEDKQQQIKEVLDTDSLDTIEFLLMSEEQGQMVKNGLKNLDTHSLRDVSIIDFSYRKNDKNHFSDFLGLDVALEKKLKDNDKKILLTSLIHTDIFLSSPKISEDRKNKLNLLLSLPNVKFLEVPYSPEDLVSMFDTDKQEIHNLNETNENIVATIQFHESSGWNPYLKEFFSTLNVKKLNLKESIVVDLRPDGGKSWDDISGLHIAYETFQKYPDSKIILCSLIPVDIFQKVITGKKTEQELNTLLQGKNVRIIQSSGGNSMTEEEVHKQFEDMYPKGDGEKSNESLQTFKQLSDISSETAFQNIMESEISRFLHDAKYWVEVGSGSNITYEEQLPYLFNLSEEKKNEKWLAFEDRMIAMLQMQHPSFKLLPRDKNLQRIVDMYKYSRTKPLPEGTRFEGVFVDWDGTLYDNKNLKFNQKIIDMIKDYERQGKKIIIRTGGNLEMKQKLLDEIGLEYKIQNKTDYKGGTVEIAVDNDSQEFLQANAKITSEHHIKV